MKDTNKIKIIGKNSQKIEITEAEQEQRKRIKKVNDEFKKINAEKSKMINEKEIWKYFFEKPKKNYNKYMCEMLEFPEYLMYNNESVDSYRGKWSEFFQNDNNIYLEIGCGSGNFTVKNAQKFKDRNYIALELRFKRLVLAAKKSKKRNLNNILFIRKRAETILDFIGKNEITGVYVNFPDPWEGEERKRVVSEDLFSRLDIILKTGGKLFFKTDHEQYYEDVLELVNNIDNYKVIYRTKDLHNSEKAEENIRTEFEEMFLSKHNMNIKYIEIEKVK
ncbi:tRNA (guanine-N(7)-)-methyltransferase [Leptotrichia hongkongensis]|uniref:tRNA (guanine-N(7)-)-methyltransferase n=1 Tax=Leptotrichia hongkongensis TaxID=554406 RepID=A0A510LA58_9FUSO|nr:tRNA (guanosine(46)-N7)-methyltransferase TrmB [Leptotrichia hongkongensis]BBM59095.1 tRNA (guanine-N(7)-)-methyltransferase [Leptotrichia hongkongensis]